MINITRYAQADKKNSDVKELHLNPANIDLLSITKFASGEKDGNPIYDDNWVRVKMLISGIPAIELAMTVEESDVFLTHFNLERGKGNV